MTEVMIMRPARVNPFCVLTFGTSGCGRLLPQRIVFMKTVNNAIKLANSLCQLSAGSLIPVQSARKPLQKKKKNCHAPGKLWWQICPTEGVGSHSMQHCCAELDEAGAENRRRWGRTGIGVAL